MFTNTTPGPRHARSYSISGKECGKEFRPYKTNMFYINALENTLKSGPESRPERLVRLKSDLELANLESFIDRLAPRRKPSRPNATSMLMHLHPKLLFFLRETVLLRGEPRAPQAFPAHNRHGCVWRFRSARRFLPLRVSRWPFAPSCMRHPILRRSCRRSRMDFRRTDAATA